jgi:uncharacterized protein YycO
MIPWSPKFLRFFTPIIRATRDVNWRFGRKYHCSDVDLDNLKTLLKPGMILLTRKDFQLSNFFIEGYWTHSGIVISKEEVIEAIGRGVIISDLKDFCAKTDNFVILKPRFCSWPEMEEASRHAAELVGFPYSYDFNNSDSSFYCSKLILKAYGTACGWGREPHKVPEEFRILCEGKIVHPINLFRNRNAWEVVFQQN